MLYNSWDDIQVSMGSRGVNSLVGTYNRGSSRAPTTLTMFFEVGGLYSDDVVSVTSGSSNTSVSMLTL